MSEKKIIKISIIFCLFIVILTVVLFATWYADMFNSDLDYCLDTGICKENLEINTAYGRIKINEQNCHKYNWQWDYKNRRCKLK